MSFLTLSSVIATRGGAAIAGTFLGVTPNAILCRYYNPGEMWKSTAKVPLYPIPSPSCSA